MRRIILSAVTVCLLVSRAWGAVEIKFATVGGPLQPEVKALEVFSKEASRLSGGRLKVRVYHSGQLGNQQAQLTGVMRGTIDMTFTDPNSLAQFYEKIGVLGAAYLFRDVPHMRKVMNGPIGREYFDAVSGRLGARPLGVWYLGTRHLNVKKPVMTPEDMRGVKLRMPNSPLWLAMGRALGANPTPLGFGEIYLALKTGVVDGQDNPLPSDKAMKFYEAADHISLTGHQIGMLWPTINEKFWQGLPAEYRKWILEAIETARTYQDKLVEDEEADVMKEFKEKHGVVFTRPNIESFRNNARRVYSEFEARWGAGAYDRIQAVR